MHTEEIKLEYKVDRYVLDNFTHFQLFLRIVVSKYILSKYQKTIDSIWINK